MMLSSSELLILYRGSEPLVEVDRVLMSDVLCHTVAQAVSTALDRSRTRSWYLLGKSPLTHGDAVQVGLDQYRIAKDRGLAVPGYPGLRYSPI